MGFVSFPTVSFVPTLQPEVGQHLRGELLGDPPLLHATLSEAWSSSGGGSHCPAGGCFFGILDGFGGWWMFWFYSVIFSGIKSIGSQLGFLFDPWPIKQRSLPSRDFPSEVRSFVSTLRDPKKVYKRFGETNGGEPPVFALKRNR